MVNLLTTPPPNLLKLLFLIIFWIKQIAILTGTVLYMNDSVDSFYVIFTVCEQHTPAWFEASHKLVSPHPVEPLNSFSFNIRIFFLFWYLGSADYFSFDEHTTSHQKEFFYQLYTNIEAKSVTLLHNVSKRKHISWHARTYLIFC